MKPNKPQIKNSPSLIAKCVALALASVSYCAAQEIPPLPPKPAELADAPFAQIEVKGDAKGSGELGLHLKKLMIKAARPQVTDAACDYKLVAQLVGSSETATTEASLLGKATDASVSSQQLTKNEDQAKANRFAQMVKVNKDNKTAYAKVSLELYYKQNLVCVGEGAETQTSSAPNTSIAGLKVPAFLKKSEKGAPEKTAEASHEMAIQIAAYRAYTNILASADKEFIKNAKPK